MRKKISLLTVCTVILCNIFFGQRHANDLFPVKALCIAAPSPAEIDSFILFIDNELPKREVNTLVLRIDYNYQYKSHPELVSGHPLSLTDIKKISSAAIRNKIDIIPQINLLGHQSWASSTSKLLEIYPEFDETPWVKMPAKYEWPNSDSLYCKSYCPLHPGVHKVVFDLVDELCDVFGAKAFHAGMDEVFYIGMDKCPRCSGKNKAELFAGEVKKIRDHLKKKNRTLYIWGDRLLDGYSTGLGMWEASYNNTYPAIDMIPKDVIICDWHYEQPGETALYFAKKGFQVITATWNIPSVGVAQSNDMKNNRANSPPEIKERLLGMMHTVWSGSKSFLQEYYYKTDTLAKSQAETFKQVFPINLNKQKKKDFSVVAYFMCNSPEEIKTIDFSRITHLHYAFLNPDSLGNFAFNECLKELATASHLNGVKILASIGGGMAPDYYSYLLNDDNRKILVNRLVQLAVDYDLDGIDIDLEGARVDINYEDFVKELKAVLAPRGKLLAAAIASAYKTQFTDEALRQYDYITLMAYDKTGPWREDEPGQHSPYSMAVDDLEYWIGTRKLNSRKLFLGLPFYGYSFGPKGAGSMSYADIVSNFPGAENSDELKMPDGSVMYYNGVQTIRKKVKLAVKRAGGVMFWQLSGDSAGEESLLRAINETAYP